MAEIAAPFKQQEMLQEDEAGSSQMPDECKLEVAREVLNAQDFLDEFMKVDAKPVASYLNTGIVSGYQLERIHHAPTNTERSVLLRQGLESSMEPDKMNIFFKVLLRMERMKAERLQRIHSSYLDKHLKECPRCSKSHRQKGSSYKPMDLSHKSPVTLESLSGSVDNLRLQNEPPQAFFREAQIWSLGSQQGGHQDTEERTPQNVPQEQKSITEVGVTQKTSSGDEINSRPISSSNNDSQDEDEENQIPIAERLTDAHKKNLLAQKSFLEGNVKTPSEVLNILAHRDIITQTKCKEILRSSTSDANITSNILDICMRGGKSVLTVLMEALLETSQRMVARVLYKTNPEKDQTHAVRPKLHQIDIPGYKLIQAEEIKFDEKHGTSGMRIALGEGSFGAVFLGTYKALGHTKVAIKQVKGSEYGGLTERDKRDFSKEADTMFTLRHPDIVTIFGVVCDSEKHLYCLVMEYMELGSMDDLLDKVEVPWPVKVRMLLSVARGLTYLNTPQHDRSYPVIHADIKAKNILINDMFQAKISDFGEARLQGITSRSITRSSKDKASGSVTHMCPELLNPPGDSPSYDPTEKSDVWSFGITIFEVCAENAKGTAERRTPFPKLMKEHQIMMMIGVTMKSPFNTEQMKKVEGCGCPQYLIDIMQRCCTIDRAERPNFRVVISELEEIYSRECQPVINSSLMKLHHNYQQSVLRPGSIISKDENLDDDWLCTESPTHSFDELDEPSSSFTLAQDMKTNITQENLAKKEDLLMMEARLANQISQIPRPSSGKDEVTGTFQNAPIQKNYVKLLEEMTAENLVPFLFQERILSTDDSERIMKAVTNRDKNILFLNAVDKKGELGLQKLRQALDSDHMEHLSEILLN